MPGSINFNDGTVASIVFEYNNFSRNTPKKGGAFYYTFVGEGAMKHNMNAHGAQAIAAVWPGKGGSLQLTRHSETQWTVDHVQQGDLEYGLQMTEWNNNTRSFATVDQWQPGMPIEGGEAPANPTPPPAHQAPPANMGPPVTPPGKAAQTVTLGELEGLAAWAVRTAANNMPDLQGDMAGAVERLAVTLYMDARKMGLTDGDGLPM